MTYKDSIDRSLKLAKYHEDLAFRYAHPSQAKYLELVAHLRAYFWELGSVWDYILQSVNEDTLKLGPQGVRDDFIKKLKKRMPDFAYIKDLEEVYNGDWLKRIKELRHYSHKWQQNPTQLEINGNDEVTVITLDPFFGMNHVPHQINIDKNDLWYMTDVVNNFREKGILR